jgi:hypothetical protein
VGRYYDDGLQHVTCIADASEKERKSLSRRRAECRIEQGLGFVVADDIKLTRAGSAFVLTHISAHLGAALTR